MLYYRLKPFGSGVPRFGPGELVSSNLYMHPFFSTPGSNGWFIVRPQQSLMTVDEEIQPFD